MVVQYKLKFLSSLSTHLYDKLQYFMNWLQFIFLNLCINLIIRVYKIKSPEEKKTQQISANLIYLNVDLRNELF